MSTSVGKYPVSSLENEQFTGKLALRVLERSSPVFWNNPLEGNPITFYEFYDFSGSSSLEVYLTK